MRTLALAAAVAVLGVAPGEEHALFLFGALTTFWQPLQTAVGAYGVGEKWARRTAGGTFVVVVTTLGILVGALVLLLGAQALVGHVGLSGAISRAPHPGGSGALPAFPYLIPLGALQFVVFLQITMICEGEPFVRLPRPWGGWAALGAAAAVALGAYFLLANWNSTSPALRASAGLAGPHGPVPADDLPAYVVVIAAWQVISLNLLGGWPGTRMRGVARRIAVNNALVLTAGTGTYAMLCKAGLAVPTIAAIGGCTVAGSRFVAVLARGDRRPETTAQRVKLTALGAAGSAAVWLALTAAAEHAHFSSQPPALWVTVMALNIVSGGIGYTTDVLPRARIPGRPQSSPQQRNLEHTSQRVTVN